MIHHKALQTVIQTDDPVKEACMMLVSAINKKELLQKAVRRY